MDLPRSFLDTVSLFERVLFIHPPFLCGCDNIVEGSTTQLARFLVPRRSKKDDRRKWYSICEYRMENRRKVKLDLQSVQVGAYSRIS